MGHVVCFVLFITLYLLMGDSEILRESIALVHLGLAIEICLADKIFVRVLPQAIYDLGSKSDLQVESFTRSSMH